MENINNKNLANQINALLGRSASKEEIYKELLVAGFSVKDIEDGLKIIRGQDSKKNSQRRATGIIALTGAIFIGAGIFSFIAANWQGIDKPLKIGIILFSMIAFYATGWFMKEKKGHDKLGGALVLLGAITYGAGIFLIGQMFHISENWPDAFILWMVGVIAVGLVMHSYSLYYLAILVGFAPVFLHPFCNLGIVGRRNEDCFIASSFFILFSAAAITFFTGWFLRRSASDDENSESNASLQKKDTASQMFFLLSLFLTGTTFLAFNKEFLGDAVSWLAVLLSVSIFGILVSYYFRMVATLAFSIIGIVVWWTTKASGWASDTDIKQIGAFAVFFFIGALLYVVGRAHLGDRFKKLSLVYLVFGNLFVTILLFVLSTNYGTAIINSAIDGKPISGSWQTLLSIVILLTFIIGTMFYNLGKKTISYFEFGAIFILAAIMEVLVFLVPYSETHSLSNLDYPLGLALAVTLNLALFFEMLGMILSGYARREKWLINFGIVFLFVFIFVKYFDWAFKFLDKSLFFIGAGVILFITVWFMGKGRKKMLESMEKDKNKIIKVNESIEKIIPDDTAVIPPKINNFSNDEEFKI